MTCLNWMLGMYEILQLSKRLCQNISLNFKTLEIKKQNDLMISH